MLAFGVSFMVHHMRPSEGKMPCKNRLELSMTLHILAECKTRVYYKFWAREGPTAPGSWSTKPWSAKNQSFFSMFSADNCPSIATSQNETSIRNMIVHKNLTDVEGGLSYFQHLSDRFLTFFWTFLDPFSRFSCKTAKNMFFPRVPCLVGLLMLLFPKRNRLAIRKTYFLE